MLQSVREGREETGEREREKGGWSVCQGGTGVDASLMKCQEVPGSVTRRTTIILRSEARERSVKSLLN